MNTEKERTYVQCLNCGHVHIVERKISMSATVLRSHCKKCGHNKGLNCGYSEMDLMELKDPYLEQRYYY